MKRGGGLAAGLELSREMKTRVPKAGTVRPESLVYLTPFAELEKEGFFAKLQ